jgi:hypothetical protein
MSGKALFSEVFPILTARHIAAYPLFSSVKLTLDCGSALTVDKINTYGLFQVRSADLVILRAAKKPRKRCCRWWLHCAAHFYTNNLCGTRMHCDTVQEVTTQPLLSMMAGEGPGRRGASQMNDTGIEYYLNSGLFRPASG